MRGKARYRPRVLHFQPKVCLATGRITGLEALPLGTRGAIGRRVIDAACGQLRAWREDRVRCAPVAVNLPAAQLLHGDVSAALDASLERYGIEPQLLEVEITEADALRNPAKTARALEQLRKRSIRIALKDFGSGFWNLRSLSRLPLDTLKLDRSFVTGLPHDAEGGSMVRAVVMMAHALGLEVIAYGVETAAQRDFLAAHGCDEMQGELFSGPLTAEACATLLGRPLERAA